MPVQSLGDLGNDLLPACWVPAATIGSSEPSSIELSVLLLSRFGVVKVELVLYVDITKPAHLPLQLATVQFEDAVVES